MTQPRKTRPQATPQTKKIVRQDWNDLQRTVDGLDAAGLPGFKARELTAFDEGERTAVCIAEMDEDMGPEVAAQFVDRTATLLRWDASSYCFRRTDPAEQIAIVTDVYDGLVLDQGQRVVCLYHAQSGKYIPIGTPTFRHVKTCDVSGTYPGVGDSPNYYPFNHVTSSYETPEPGVWQVAPTHVEMSTEYPSNQPHGYVLNLAGTSAAAYIPEDTVVPAWFHNSLWWTYWLDLS